MENNTCDSDTQTNDVLPSPEDYLRPCADCQIKQEIIQKRKQISHLHEECATIRGLNTSRDKHMHGVQSRLINEIFQLKQRLAGLRPECDEDMIRRNYELQLRQATRFIQEEFSHERRKTESVINRQLSQATTKFQQEIKDLREANERMVKTNMDNQSKIRQLQLQLLTASTQHATNKDKDGSPPTSSRTPRTARRKSTAAMVDGLAVITADTKTSDRFTTNNEFFEEVKTQLEKVNQENQELYDKLKQLEETAETKGKDEQNWKEMYQKLEVASTETSTKLQQEKDEKILELSNQVECLKGQMTIIVNSSELEKADLSKKHYDAMQEVQTTICTLETALDKSCLPTDDNFSTASTPTMRRTRTHRLEQAYEELSDKVKALGHGITAEEIDETRKTLQELAEKTLKQRDELNSQVLELTKQKTQLQEANMQIEKKVKEATTQLEVFYQRTAQPAVLLRELQEQVDRVEKLMVDLEISNEIAVERAEAVDVLNDALTERVEGLQQKLGKKEQMLKQLIDGMKQKDEKSGIYEHGVAAAVMLAVHEQQAEMLVKAETQVRVDPKQVPLKAITFLQNIMDNSEHGGVSSGELEKPATKPNHDHNKSKSTPTKKRTSTSSASPPPPPKPPLTPPSGSDEDDELQTLPFGMQACMRILEVIVNKAYKATCSDRAHLKPAQERWTKIHDELKDLPTFDRVVAHAQLLIEKMIYKRNVLLTGEPYHPSHMQASHDAQALLNHALRITNAPYKGLAFSIDNNHTGSFSRKSVRPLLVPPLPLHVLPHVGSASKLNIEREQEKQRHLQRKSSQAQVHRVTKHQQSLHQIMVSQKHQLKFQADIVPPEEMMEGSSSSSGSSDTHQTEADTPQAVNSTKKTVEVASIGLDTSGLADFAGVKQKKKRHYGSPKPQQTVADQYALSSSSSDEDVGSPKDAAQQTPKGSGRSSVKPHLFSKWRKLAKPTATTKKKKLVVPEEPEFDKRFKPPMAAGFGGMHHTKSPRPATATATIVTSKGRQGLMLSVPEKDPSTRLITGAISSKQHSLTHQGQQQQGGGGYVNNGDMHGHPANPNFYLTDDTASDMEDRLQAQLLNLYKQQELIQYKLKGIQSSHSNAKRRVKGRGGHNTFSSYIHQKRNKGTSLGSSKYTHTSEDPIAVTTAGEETMGMTSSMATLTKPSNTSESELQSTTQVDVTEILVGRPAGAARYDKVQPVGIRAVGDREWRHVQSLSGEDTTTTAEEEDTNDEAVHYDPSPSAEVVSTGAAATLGEHTFLGDELGVPAFDFTDGQLTHSLGGSLPQSTESPDIPFVSTSTSTFGKPRPNKKHTKRGTSHLNIVRARRDSKIVTKEGLKLNTAQTAVIPSDAKLKFKQMFTTTTQYLNKTKNRGTNLI